MSSFSPERRSRRHSLTTHSLRSHSATPVRTTYVDPYLSAYPPPPLISRGYSLSPYHHYYDYPASSSGVTMVGGKSSYFYPHYRPAHYNPYLSRATAIEQAVYDQALPTSSLRAHAPPTRHQFTSGAEDYLRRYPLYRSYSNWDLYDDYLDVAPRRRTPIRHHSPYRSSRLTSVPPSASASLYRPLSYYTSDYSHSPITNIYSNRYYTSHHEPVTTRSYSHYYPSITRSYITPTYTTTSPSAYSSDVKFLRRRIDSRRYKNLFITKSKLWTSLEKEHHHLQCECPSCDVYRKVQGERYKMPELPRLRGPSMATSPLVSEIYYTSPKTTTGYGPSLVSPEGGRTSELRGRIRRLLCRSRQDPHYHRYLPSAAATVKC